MSFIAWIIIGGLAGWIAERVSGADHGLLTNIVLGILGATVGNWLLSLAGLIPEPGFIPSLITAVVGALALIYVWRAVRRA
jgi:uncharacterized membrane protein YeaQ/YmgE (transglycosylase-associated protein family)